MSDCSQQIHEAFLGNLLEIDYPHELYLVERKLRSVVAERSSVSDPSSGVVRISECGFESRPGRLRRLCT